MGEATGDGRGAVVALFGNWVLAAGLCGVHPAGTGPGGDGRVSRTRCGLTGTNRPAVVGDGDGVK